MQVRDAAGKAERQKMRCMHAYITDIVSMILAGTLYRFTSPPSQRTCVSLPCPQTLKNAQMNNNIELRLKLGKLVKAIISFHVRSPNALGNNLVSLAAACRRDTSSRYSAHLEA